MSYAFTGRYLFSFSGLCGKIVVTIAKLLKITNKTNPRKDKYQGGQDFDYTFDKKS